MKAVIFNGAKEKDSTIDKIETELNIQLTEKGWTVEQIELRNQRIAGCLGCFGCWVKTPGMCVIDDYGRVSTEKALQADLLVWLTPITFGGYSSELKKAVDRLLPILLPYFESYHGQIHHKMRYSKYPNLLVVGTSPLCFKYEETFSKLTERNVLNLRPPTHAVGIFRDENVVDGVPSFVEGLLSQVQVE
jgi:multimeric flavodoxin WrbA